MVCKLKKVMGGCNTQIPPHKYVTDNIQHDYMPISQIIGMSPSYRQNQLIFLINCIGFC